MKQRRLVFQPAAQADILDIWELVAANDGPARADSVLRKIEALCRSLATMPAIGTRHDDRYPGLRSTGVPGLRRASVIFQVGETTVVVLRVGYLGRDVFAAIPDPR